ncbi:hypothetical protein [Halobacillus locisalis]|uniref:hypothetical protein n=1 Tax=Halobacillus locisalis TaxID=220753 RepID=UPI001FECA8E5|nr:hypothetical protein [Halobacillus locisalis]
MNEPLLLLRKSLLLKSYDSAIDVIDVANKKRIDSATCHILLVVRTVAIVAIAFKWGA